MCLFSVWFTFSLRLMIDGSHCGRPHPHHEHDRFIAKERQTRIELGSGEMSCWDPEADLHYGVMEINPAKLVPPADLDGMRHREHQHLCEATLDKWFQAKDSAVAKLTFRDSRRVVYERYMQEKRYIIAAALAGLFHLSF